jgi:hypothetical protein
MLISSIPCGSKMSDYVLLKTVKIYIVVKNKTVCVYVVCCVYVVDISPMTHISI